jgi:amphi-Trp domain-containing protein
MERVLFEMESEMSGAEIGEYLRKIADKVERGDSIKLGSDSQSVELDTDRPAEFEVKVEEEDGEESLELEIEWTNSRENSGNLSIE